VLARCPAERVIAIRTQVTAQALAEQFAALGRLSACSYDEPARESGFDIVLNVTSQHDGCVATGARGCFHPRHTGL
jgi:shikimate 5-dehydrogenase